MNKRVLKIPSLPPRPAQGNKGTFGRVLVIAGSEGMLGAASAAGASALRMGAGLVQVAAPKGILSSVLSLTPELIGIGLPSAELGDSAEKAKSIVIGPGLGQSPHVQKMVRQILRVAKPMVVDADALNCLSRLPRWPADIKARCVLTPHPGEMLRLMKFLGGGRVPSSDEGRARVAAAAAKALGQVVLLKGQRTVVSDGTRVYVNRSGDSSLAKAGTGDVLSGMIGALLAQKMDPFEAACLGAYLHGRAGEAAGRKLGKRFVLASDVMAALSAVLRKHERA